jgi:hypothetical protein
MKDNYAQRVLLVQIYRLILYPKMYANAYIFARNAHGMCAALVKASINITDNKWKRIEELLPGLTSLGNIYRIASLSGKQALIRGCPNINLHFRKGHLEHQILNLLFQVTY